MDCSDVAAYGSLALDQALPDSVMTDVAAHVRDCADCTSFIDQMAKTRALLGFRPGDTSPAQNQEHLLTLARAADPAHADDLVQETWDHFLTASPGVLPSREDLAAYLLGHVDEHARAEESENHAWADSLLRHHRHHAGDAAGPDPSTGAPAEVSLGRLADLDALDPDADRAELYLPDLYEDGPDQGTWETPPVAWPTVSHLLTPDDETGTAELYSVVDAALDELPDGVGDAVYLIDIEGHSLETASSLLQRDPSDVQRDLARARHHVRGRVNDYLVTS